MATCENLLRMVLRARVTRRSVWPIVCGVALSVGGTAMAKAQAARWVSTWATSPMPVSILAAGPLKNGLAHRRVRQVVPLSVGGTTVRVRLTNRYGATPVILDELTVGAVGPGVAAVPLTFGGQPHVHIPAGAAAFSDPVRLRVEPLSDLIDLGASADCVASPLQGSACVRGTDYSV